jgi:hypothetical protein
MVVMLRDSCHFRLEKVTSLVVLETKHEVMMIAWEILICVVMVVMVVLYGDGVYSLNGMSVLKWA